MVVGRNNGVVGLTGFLDKKMSGLLFGPQKSGRNNGVVVLTGWSYGGVPLYYQNNSTSSPGFLGQRFNNLQKAAFLTSF